MQGLLVGATAMLAIRTGHEELAVGEDEAAQFLKAAQNVARHYSVETTQRTLDWIAFVGVTAQVFVTRAVAVAVKEGRKRRPQATVYDFGGARPNGADRQQAPQTDTGEVPDYVPSVVPPSDYDA